MNKKEREKVFNVSPEEMRRARLRHLRAELRGARANRDKWMKWYYDYPKKDDYFIEMHVKKYGDEVEGLQKNVDYYMRKDRDDIDLEEIRKIPIPQILATRNIKIIRRFFKIRNENTPSAFYYKDKNRWYDFGAGEGGSVIDLIMKLDSCSVGDAIKELKKYL